MKNYISILLVVVLAFTTVNVFAQERATGLIFDDAEYQKMPHLPRYDGIKYNSLPFKVSLREYSPFPGDQGNVGSCVGWATANALTISKAVKHEVKDRTSISSVAHSAAFIYNQIRVSSNDCWGGSRITDAMLLLLNNGNCLESAFRYDPNDCSAQPDANAMEQALDYKIKDFAAIFKHTNEPAVKIDKTLKALANKTPVVIGMNITNSFWTINNGVKKWDPADNELPITGHAMTVVGYSLMDKTFEIMNSYGTNWGDEGYIRMSFDDFGRLVKYGFMMVLDDNIQFEPSQEEQDEPVYCDLKGDFIFRYPTGVAQDDNGKDIFQFEEAQTTYNNERGLYELVRKNWQVNDVFQLVARNVPQGDYVYVFSINPKDKLELHWPLSEEVTFAMERVKLADFVQNEMAEIVMPGPEDALRLELPGEDFLCVLYSDQEIVDLKNRLETVKNATGNIHDRLQAGFGDLMVKANEATYSPGQMRFNCQASDTAKTVVPMVLAVTAQ